MKKCCLRVMTYTSPSSSLFSILRYKANITRCVQRIQVFMNIMALNLRDNPLNISWIGESSVFILTLWHCKSSVPPLFGTPPLIYTKSRIL